MQILAVLIKIGTSKIQNEIHNKNSFVGKEWVFKFSKRVHRDCTKQKVWSNPVCCKRVIKLLHSFDKANSIMQYQGCINFDHRVWNYPIGKECILWFWFDKYCLCIQFPLVIEQCYFTNDCEDQSIKNYFPMKTVSNLHSYMYAAHIIGRGA